MVFRFQPDYRSRSLHQRKMWSDVHIHSHFSPDAHHSIDDLCRRALDLGLGTIAITDHVEWRRQGYGNTDLEGYFEEIWEAQAVYQPSGLTVMSGVELGNPHQYPSRVSALLSIYPFEVVIASLHWLGEDNVHQESIFHGRSPGSVYRRYFLELGALIEGGDFDILAHPDRIFWMGLQLGHPPDLDQIGPLIDAFTKRLASRGLALEFNTKYLDQHPRWNGLALTLLRSYRAAGGTRVVVNSDAHRPEEMGRSFSRAGELLIQAGFSDSAHLIPSAQSALLP